MFRFKVLYNEGCFVCLFSCFKCSQWLHLSFVKERNLTVYRCFFVENKYHKFEILIIFLTFYSFLNWFIGCKKKLTWLQGVNTPSYFSEKVVLYHNKTYYPATITLRFFIIVHDTLDFNSQFCSIQLSFTGTKSPLCSVELSFLDINEIEIRICRAEK